MPGASATRRDDAEQKVARRRPARRGEGGSLRDDLVEAASAMVARSGDAGSVTLRALAREVGVAATSIYLHFASVDEVLDEVKRVRFGELAAALSAAADAAGSDPPARVKARGHAYVRYGAEHPGEYAVMFTARLTAPTPFPRVQFAADALDDVGVDVAAALARYGRPADRTTAHLVAIHLWTSLHGSVSLRALRQHLEWPDLDVEVDDLAERLLGAPRPTRGRTPTKG